MKGIPFPLREEGMKNLEYSPSPYPLPRGERINILKLKRNSLSFEMGGETLHHMGAG
jgi:hypothetical protein